MPRLVDLVERTRAWVVGSPTDQARFRAVLGRLGALTRLGVLVGVPHLVTGWFADPLLWLLVALAVATLVAGRLLHAWWRHPEQGAVVVVVALLLNTAASAWLSGGASSPLLVLLAVPVFTQAVGLRIPVLLANAGAAVVLAAVVAATAPPLPPDRTPPPWVSLVSFAVLVVMLCAVAGALTAVETSTRAEASTDPLTGLRQRRGLDELWTGVRARDDAAGRATSVLLLDVDHFKQVNDLHGHDRGDRVLVAVAERLRAAVRHGDLVVRVGGEEFAVLLPDADDALAGSIAERLRCAVADRPAAGVPVTVSVGTASTTVADLPLSDVLREADRAMYEAKRGGRNTVRSAPAAGTPGRLGDFPSV